MKHLEENNETYFSHFFFACKIAIYLYLCSIFLVIHAVFPFFDVPEYLNLNNTCKLINKWNIYAQERKK